MPTYQVTYISEVISVVEVEAESEEQAEVLAGQAEAKLSEEWETTSIQTTLKPDPIIQAIPFPIFNLK